MGVPLAVGPGERAGLTSGRDRVLRDRESVTTAGHPLRQADPRLLERERLRRAAVARDGHACLQGEWLPARRRRCVERPPGERNLRAREQTGDRPADGEVVRGALDDDVRDALGTRNPGAGADDACLTAVEPSLGRRLREHGDRVRLALRHGCGERETAIVREREVVAAVVLEDERVRAGNAPAARPPEAGERAAEVKGARLRPGDTAEGRADVRYLRRLRGQCVGPDSTLVVALGGSRATRAAASEQPEGGHGGPPEAHPPPRLGAGTGTPKRAR